MYMHIHAHMLHICTLLHTHIVIGIRTLCVYTYICTYVHVSICGTIQQDGVICEDLLSALLSLYTEYLLLIEDKGHMITMSGHVISLLYLLLG